MRKDWEGIIYTPKYQGGGEYLTIPESYFVQFIQTEYLDKRTLFPDTWTWTNYFK